MSENRIYLKYNNTIIKYQIGTARAISESFYYYILYNRLI